MPEDVELKALLEENLKIAKENQEMLKQMRRIGRIAFWAKVVIWTLLIIVPLLFLGSFLGQFSSSLGENAGVSIMGMPSPDMVRDAYELYTGQE